MQGAIACVTQSFIVFVFGDCAGSGEHVIGHLADGLPCVSTGI